MMPITTDFRIEAMQEAIHRYGTPEIFNTEGQLVQQPRHGIAISMG